MMLDPADFGVVFALGIEAGALQDRLDDLVTTRGQGFIARKARSKTAAWS